jgi:hypothetical protein
LRLAAKSREVLKRFDAWKEEVGTARYGRKSGQTLYPLADRTLWNCEVKRAVLQADHRIVLITELVEIRVVYPNVLNELELADET